MSNPDTALTEPAAETVAQAPKPTTEATPPPPPATGSKITTFPELMTAITTNGLSQEVVLGAVQAVGLQALPLVAARPDLIPQVAQRLGL